MKTIEERATEWGEHIFETTPYDVVNGKACVFVEDRDIADVAKESYIAGATGQKAIDEEVRLKKCDDMTEAEYNREAAFVDWYLENGKGMPAYSDAIEWARKETIDKACKCFCKTCRGQCKDNSHCDVFQVFRNELNAMEG